MKNYIFLASIALSLLIGISTGCTKDNTSTDPIDETIDTTGASTKLKGNFVSNAHTTSGTVSVLEKDGKKTLQFDAFATDNGPDLKVYLATGTNASTFTDLGDLKSINGAFFYDIPADVDLASKKYVLIWCQDFSVLFGHAVLK